jgi:hypothetical protein
MYGYENRPTTADFSFEYFACINTYEVDIPVDLEQMTRTGWNPIGSYKQKRTAEPAR